LLINTAWLGEQIEPALAPLAAQLDSRIRYSHEGLDFGGALETAGGIARALPHLADVFWVVAGDVYAPQFAFSREAFDRFAASSGLAHLYLVPNPAHNPGGDFGLDGHSQRALNLAAGHPERRYTFSTIALYRREFFAGVPAGNPQGLKLALAPLLRQAMDRGQVSAEVYTGAWTDVGTPERLAELNTV
jgi:MurNAc alpha-1-phosphate uridylyltransferase